MVISRACYAWLDRPKRGYKVRLLNRLFYASHVELSMHAHGRARLMILDVRVLGYTKREWRSVIADSLRKMRYEIRRHRDHDLTRR